MTIRIESVADPQSVLDVLLPELEEEMFKIYGIPGQLSEGPPEYFVFPRGRLWVAYVDDELAAMAGWTNLSKLKEPNPFDVPVAEIKRLFTRAQFQRHGLSRKLDSYLLHDIFANGYELAVGETGLKQVASVNMHSVAPYITVQPFGEFGEAHDSFFFGVTLEGWRQHIADGGV